MKYVGLRGLVVYSGFKLLQYYLSNLSSPMTVRVTQTSITLSLNPEYSISDKKIIEIEVFVEGERKVELSIISTKHLVECSNIPSKIQKYCIGLVTQKQKGDWSQFYPIDSTIYIPGLLDLK